MKVWKSPVLYFGILLVAAIAGLLVAPFIIDWNSYRADLESYGKKLTGRTVKIEGPISAQLFPLPELTAVNVRIANPPGLESPEFASADRIRIKMSLAGLLQGGIDVQSVDIENPEVHFERLATGEGNWTFTPAADLIQSDLLSRVKLDRIAITGGTLEFSDRRRGEILRLDDINASISSPSVAGPWRLRSVSVYNDKPVDISVSTAIWAPDQPFRFGITVKAADGSGLVYTFDGAQSGQTAEGQLRIEPAAHDDGKGDAEGRVRPLVFTSDVKASFDRVEMPKIEIVHRDPAQGGAVTQGSARIELGRHITARIDLSSAMLDLDDLAGARSRTLLREAGGLALAESLLTTLPPDLSLAGSLSATSLKSGGENFSNLGVDFDADSQGLRINRFTTGLPGRSELAFAGKYFSGDIGAQLDGKLELVTNDLRALAEWGLPQAKPGLSAAWTGSRGRFKMISEMNLTAAQLRLSDIRYELDSEAGTAELLLGSAGRGTGQLSIETGRLDIDSFVPDGLPVMPSNGQGLADLISLVLPHENAPDLRLSLKAGELLLNKVTAEKVVLNVESAVSGLDIRELSIGSVGGAKLDARGSIGMTSRGADGSLNLDIAAEDPQELLRLLGLVHGDTLPPWATDLGPTVLRGGIKVVPSPKGSSEVTMSLEGKAGELEGFGQLVLDGAFSAALDVDLSTPTSGRIVKLAGMVPAADDKEPGRLRLKATTLAEGGFAADAFVEAFGARFDYSGAADPAAPMLGLNGKVNFRSTEPAVLIAASGIPLQSPPEGSLNASARVAVKDGVLALSDLSGFFRGNNFSGAVTLSPRMELAGSIDADRVSLREVLPALFLNWSGAGPDLEASFAGGLPLGLKGTLDIRSKQLGVTPDFEARDGSVQIAATPDEISLAVFAKDDNGHSAFITLNSAGTDSRRALKGELRIPVDLARHLSLAGGGPVAEGLGLLELKFQSQGRSPGGALAELEGSGSYEINGLKLRGLTPAAFLKALSDAKDSGGIAAAFDALRNGEGVDFGRVLGQVTITKGAVAFFPFSARLPEANIQVKTLAELALGEIDVDVALSFNGQPPLPAMSLSYAGPPHALVRSEDITELSTKLGVEIMQQGIDELERLQKEQQRLAEQEEKQRIEDEARLAAYYAQRDELLLRRRELKVHSEMLVIEAERLRRQLEAERAANAEINKIETRQRVREIRFYRRLARLTQQQQPKPPRQNAQQQAAPPVEASAEPPPKARAETKPQPVGPVILAKPEGAPVIISPEPGASPTQ